MKTILSRTLIAATIALISTQAVAADTTCQKAIQSLKSEWNVVDYPAPSKPTAMRVEGKYGHENSAAQIAYMQEQMKKADTDCQAGNQQSALQRVSLVQDLLDAHGLSSETANAAMIEKQ